MLYNGIRVFSLRWIFFSEQTHEQHILKGYLLCIFTHLGIQGCKDNDCEVLAMPMWSYAFDIVKFCAIAQSEVKFAEKHLRSKLHYEVTSLPQATSLAQRANLVQSPGEIVSISPGDCGADDRTRTCTLARWNLNPMSLPIPPHPHIELRIENWELKVENETNLQWSAIF